LGIRIYKGGKYTNTMLPKPSLQTGVAYGLEPNDINNIHN